MSENKDGISFKEFKEYVFKRLENKDNAAFIVEYVKCAFYQLDEGEEDNEVDEDMILYLPWLSITIGDAISLTERKQRRRSQFDMIIEEVFGLE